MSKAETELTPLAKILLGSIVALVILIGIAIGGVAIFYNNNNADVVIIKAETEPYKITPADKGGQKINSLDSPVLSLLDKTEDLTEGVEVLRPAISEPEPPPIDVTDETQSQETESQESQSQETESQESQSQETQENIASAQDSTSKAEITATEPQENASAGPEVTENTPETDNADENEITAAIDNLAESQSNVAEIIAEIDTDTPYYVVQLAAFKDKDRAQNTAAVLSTQHKSRLNGVTLGYMRGGDFWRVVVEPMPRADAISLCKKFKSAGQDCFIKLVVKPNG